MQQRHTTDTDDDFDDEVKIKNNYPHVKKIKKENNIKHDITISKEAFKIAKVLKHEK